jgi:uncharacterized protein YdhG (YjbR/CyaY superfamily)
MVRAVAKAKEVEDWFARLDHPLKKAMLRARQHILAADRRIGETIKWQCPMFVFNGNLVSINPKAKSHVSLLFHTGAQIPGKHPKLEGGGGTARYMKFADLKDVDANKVAITSVVRAWCDWKAPARG